jgi:hypothetical protein
MSREVKMTDTVEDLKDELLQKKKYRKKTWTCEFDDCSELIFKNHVKYKEHMEKTHSAIMYKYLCNICSEGFDKKNLIIIHYNNVHKAFKCDKCNFETNRKYNMERHNKTHDKNAVNLLYCSDCNHSYSTTFNLNRHIKSKHKEEKQAIEKRTECLIDYIKTHYNEYNIKKIKNDLTI